MGPSIYTHSDMIHRNWYTSIELWRGTFESDELDATFTHTFDFADDHPSIDAAFQVIKTKIFEDIPVWMTNINQRIITIQNLMEYCNVTSEPDDDEPHDVNIPMYEGTHTVERFGILSN